MQQGWQLVMMVVCIALLCPAVYAQERASDTGEEKESRWYLIHGQTNTHPRLENAAKQISRQVDLPMKLLMPGHSDVRTFEDQRDDFMIWSFLLGFGRVMSDKCDVFFQVGYSEGTVETEQSKLSLLLLPFHSDFEIERSNFFAGVGTTFFPMGIARLDKYETISDRLKETKPFLNTSLNWNYLTFEADQKFGPIPFSNLIRIKQEDEWSIWSMGVNLGADVPLSKRTVLSMNGGYTFFFDNAEDFSGPTLTFLCKRYF